MSITSTKPTILIHNFNFDEKFLIQFKKFNKKNYIIYQKSIKLRLKQIEKPT